MRRLCINIYEVVVLLCLLVKRVCGGNLGLAHSRKGFADAVRILGNASAGLLIPPSVTALLFMDDTDRYLQAKEPRADPAGLRAKPLWGLGPGWNDLQGYQHDVPRDVNRVLEGMVENACERLCHQRGKRGVADSSCCDPREWCQSMFSKFLDVAKDAMARFQTYRAQWDSRLQLMRYGQALDFLQLPSMLPLLLGVIRLVEDTIRFAVVIGGRVAASPTLSSCMATRNGAELRKASLEMLDMWRDLQDLQKDYFWELVATSRFHSAEMSKTDEHTIRMTWCLEKALPLIARFQEALTYGHSNPEGWATMQLTTGISTAAAQLGAYSDLEIARVVFKKSYFLDKGVTRFLLRHVLLPGQTIGEFGAGSGHYSDWFNETGLVQAFAFEGSLNVESSTGGRVQYMQLTEDVDLGRTFDWILCLEVGEHIPKEFEHVVLRNIARHARQGIIMSWGTYNYPHAEHVNLKSVEESKAFIESHGFEQDVGLSTRLREACELMWVKESVAVYYRRPS